MFNDKYGLTQAVLEGTKTMTRRIIKTPFEDVKAYHANWSWHFIGDIEGESFELTPRYQIGETVAIAQPYKSIIAAITPTFGSPHTYDKLREEAGWNNKMFVRADLMPHRIRITDINVERLQDISEEDAMREGVFRYDKPPLNHENDMFAPWPPYVRPYKHDIDNLKYRCTARHAFASLIDRMCGKGTWESNPFVFAYTFKKI